MTTTSDQSTWGFEYNFRYLPVKWFFRKLPRKLRSAFFHNDTHREKLFYSVQYKND